MPNYNSTLQSNNIDLQTILDTINNLPNAGGEQAVPVISVSSNGLVTATAGDKTTTHQLAFQPAKTITPSTASQIAVSSGYYTGGNITVAAVPTQTKSVTPKATAQNITPDSGKFLSKVTVDAIPSSYIVPSGTLNITENGTHDVKNYASAVVNVSGGASSGEQVEWSANEDAMVSRTISNYFNDRVTSVGNYAFYNCSALTTVSFPVATTINNGAFNTCSALTTVSFPVATTIGHDAFYNCSALTTVSFPAARTISDYAFGDCFALTTVSFPVATTISNYAFHTCSALTTVSFPAARTIGRSVFYNCFALTTVSFPVATTITAGVFKNCSALTTVSFPVATTIDIGAFSNCFALTTVSFPAARAISNDAFRYCYNLKSLYLTGSSLCTLSNSNAFSSTPIGGYSASAGTYGSIYVPASLLTSYQTATNWTYFSSRFVGVDGEDTGEDTGGDTGGGSQGGDTGGGSQGGDTGGGSQGGVSGGGEN